MNIDEFFKTLKTRQEDFQYSPFLSSYVFFWIYFNSKMILIFISSKLDIQYKIDNLAYADVNYEMPFYYAATYTILLPFITTMFYAITRFHESLKNFIQNFFDGFTPPTKKQSIRVNQEKREAKEELNKVKDELIEIRATYETKEKELNESIQIQKDSMDATINDKTIELTDKINKLEEDIKRYQSIPKPNDSIEKETAVANKEIINTTNFTNEQIKVLSALSIEPQMISIDNFANHVKKDYNISHALTRLRLTEFEKLNLISITSGTYITLTTEGLQAIELLTNEGLVITEESLTKKYRKTTF